ncbi:phosphotransferase family protein [Porticoccaceae bacterium]|nr:phosphotransferase family protein [Porticoccaceae bacterium]MDB9969688.1 phosphotransferase family protein [Porticoccaceae bacterium]MDC0010932.1 phosphotransferase family protein [Porticoccaceae bacterium]MDC1453557.1 phosphotransferase family protein [Porticoccaceae bacterium]
MSQVSSLDESKLLAYLEASVEGFLGPISVSKFAGGQSNPTFKIDAASGSYVLRRQPPGELLKSAHAVDREYRVIKALADTDVPVAKAYHLCEDRDVIGSMFYLMEFCEGNIHWRPELNEVESPAQRGQMYDEMIKVLAAIHSVDIDRAGLSDYGRPGNYFQRQLDRWSAQYRASELETIHEMERLIVWLGDNMPADDSKVSLVHGDYRLDNLMYAKDNSRVIAVLDWELSTLGHPYADLAYLIMGMKLPASPNKDMVGGLGAIDWASQGIPNEEEIVARYCELANIDKIENWNFCMAFSFFRLAAICQGVAKRAVDGNASNAAADGVAGLVRPLAKLAMDYID